MAQKTYGIAFTHLTEPTMYYTAKAEYGGLSANIKNASFAIQDEDTACFAREVSFHNDITLNGYTPIVIEKDEEGIYLHIPQEDGSIVRRILAEPSSHFVE